MKDIILNHQTVILKEIFKELEKLIKQKEKVDDTALTSAENSKSINTQRHWQAVAIGDNKVKEINELLEELKELDSLTNWNNRYIYNQEKLKFINKYPKALKAYKFKYK